MAKAKGAGWMCLTVPSEQSAEPSSRLESAFRTVLKLSILNLTIFGRLNFFASRSFSKPFCFVDVCKPVWRGLAEYMAYRH